MLHHHHHRSRHPPGGWHRNPGRSPHCCSQLERSLPESCHLRSPSYSQSVETRVCIHTYPFLFPDWFPFHGVSQTDPLGYWLNGPCHSSHFDTPSSPFAVPDGPVLHVEATAHPELHHCTECSGPCLEAASTMLLDVGNMNSSAHQFASIGSLRAFQLDTTPRPLAS